MLPAGIIISYLLGSIPTAYILGRLIKGIDIRKFGSGNVGATNAFRLLGGPWAAVVLTADAAKGAVAVTILANYLLGYWNGSALSLRILLGVVCIFGHNWTLFLRFKGGKGVATTFGVLLGLGMTAAELRLILLLVALVWLAVFLFLRVVSVASILSAVSFPVFVLILQRSRELLLLSIILSVLIVWRHKSNIIGIIHKREGPPGAGGS